MSILGWIIAIVVGVYVAIGSVHASVIHSDNYLTPRQFLTLILCWPWRGRSAL